MGPWQTGRAGAWSLAERGGTLGGASGGARKAPGLDERGRKSEKKTFSQAAKTNMNSASFFRQYLCSSYNRVTLNLAAFFD